MGCTAVERDEGERWGDGVALVCAVRYFRREWDAIVERPPNVHEVTAPGQDSRTLPHVRSHLVPYAL